MTQETEDEEAEIKNECYLLSEKALSVDWNRPEEDAAWAHLQEGEDAKSDLICVITVQKY